MCSVYARNLRLIAMCCMVVAGCGSKPTEGASPAKSSASATTAARKVAGTSDSDGTASDGAPYDCGMYAAGGNDMMSGSAAYLFIGDHPMCTDKDKLKEFCATLTTAKGFLQQEHDSSLAESLQESVGKSLPEDAREGYMASHPKRAFEQAMVKCGLNLDGVRSKLIDEGEAALNAGRSDDTISFFVMKAPARAEAVWKRECAGRMAQKTVGEGLDWDFKGNPKFKGFCQGYSDSESKPVKFKPADPN